MTLQIRLRHLRASLPSFAIELVEIGASVELGATDHLHDFGQYLLAALGIALDSALGLTSRLGSVGCEAFGGFANLAKARMLVYAVRRCGVQLDVNGLAPRGLRSPAKRG